MKYITGKNTDPLDREGRLDSYLSELRKPIYEPLLLDEEKVIIDLFLQGDNSARDILIKRNLRYVVYVAKRYQKVWHSTADLINEGNVGLIVGVDNIPTKFDKLRTPSGSALPLLTFYIQGNIVNYIYKNGNIIKIPQNLIIASRKVERLREKLIQENEFGLFNNQVTEEISIKTNHSINHVDFLLNLQKVSTSINEVKRGKINPDTLLVTEEPYENTIVSDLNPDLEVNMESLKQEVRWIIKTILSRREVEILSAYFGFNEEGLTIEDIEANYEITKERIRQIKERAIKRLQRYTSDRIITVMTPEGTISEKKIIGYCKVLRRYLG